MNQSQLLGPSRQSSDVFEDLEQIWRRDGCFFDEIAGHCYLSFKKIIIKHVKIRLCGLRKPYACTSEGLGNQASLIGAAILFPRRSFRALPERTEKLHLNIQLWAEVT